MRTLLAAAAVTALTVSAPVFAKAHLQPAARAQFGQNTAAASIAKNDDKSMKSSNSSMTKTETRSSTTKSAGTSTKPNS